ncbi:charged multivesicular body protein 1a-like protein [Euroglyphus maynei]|uniref:Charged multivesicular body protein 1a-like protein n=1 Tax=Euroglyphus maynei TaxID=6958 RepID=A0A1Y3B902_EURMA|nr:charged multivesicular body protein 1a-like protein [Euroglyphus maynei]
MDKHLFNLKFATKELERHSKRAEKQERVQKLKCKKAIQNGNVEGARIYAENAIREKNQALNFLRMASRVDAVASRVQTAVATKSIAQSIGGVTKAMDSAMRSMNLEKISQIMDKFEKQFEDLDVQTNTMESTISNAMGTMSPEAQTDSLMKQIADEAGLELNLELPNAASSTLASAKESTKEDELSKRLAALRSM